MIQHEPRLEVITGCMSSGKSEELIRLLRRAEIAGLEARVFKPAKDTRVGAQVCSRNGICLDAVEVASAGEIPGAVADTHRIVAIDEGHFFSADLVPTVESLLAAGKRVIVSGLDLDFRGEPFEVMAALIARAYPVYKLTAVCMRCKHRPATRSQRLVAAQERELVGDRAYEPRCLACFAP